MKNQMIYKEVLDGATLAVKTERGYICGISIGDRKVAKQICDSYNFCLHVNPEKLQMVLDFDNLPEDGYFEAPHPVFAMAQDIDNLRAKLRAVVKIASDFINAYERHYASISVSSFCINMKRELGLLFIKKEN